MWEDLTNSEVAAETVPVEYSKIPYVIELREYTEDDPEADAKADDECSRADCVDSGDSAVVDTD
jgi:hypothetical protein